MGRIAAIVIGSVLWAGCAEPEPPPVNEDLNAERRWGDHRGSLDCHRFADIEAEFSCDGVVIDSCDTMRWAYLVHREGDDALWHGGDNTLTYDTDRELVGAIVASGRWWRFNIEYFVARRGTYDDCTSVEDADGDGFLADVDCDDTNAAINPEATDGCDGVDTNCDGSVDSEPDITWFADADGDGTGDAAEPVLACEQPAGAVLDDTDCNDADPAISPAGAEVCSGVDEDCDGSVDDEDSSVDVSTGSIFFADADGDGFGDPAVTAQACAVPDGFTANPTDCDDASGAVNPAATEVCDGVDNDCDEQLFACVNGACNVAGACGCATGWAGDACDENVNECADADACGPNEACVDSPGSFACECQLTCANGEASAGCDACECDAGWTGALCDVDINECDDASSCQNAELCENTSGGFECLCPLDCGSRGQPSADCAECECDAGWTGERCDEDVNECDDASSCENTEVCENTSGGFECVCALECGDFGQPSADCAVCECDPGLTGAACDEPEFFSFSFDFNQDATGVTLAHGTTIGAGFQPYADYGVTIRTNDPNNHPLRIFDTGDADGSLQDPDLGTPNETYGGRGVGIAGEQTNTFYEGNGLIINRNTSATTNDSAGGGLVFVDFDQPTCVHSARVLDFDDSASTIQLFAGNTLLTTVNGIGTGDNGVATVEVPKCGVTRFELQLDSGGALLSLNVLER